MNNKTICNVGSLSISNILWEANKLGLLIETQETSYAFNKTVNRAILIIKALDPFNVTNHYLPKNNAPGRTIDELNRTTKIPPNNIANILGELVKLEIVGTTNGYYYLIPF